MSGHAAAEPTTVMKSRRLIVAPEAQTRNGSNRHWCSGRVDVRPTDVRFGSKADICGAISHVRFTPNSDRNSGHTRAVSQRVSCLIVSLPPSILLQRNDIRTAKPTISDTVPRVVLTVFVF